jgi:hypothetical protein
MHSSIVLFGFQRPSFGVCLVSFSSSERRSECQGGLLRAETGETSQGNKPSDFRLFRCQPLQSFVQGNQIRVAMGSRQMCVIEQNAFSIPSSLCGIKHRDTTLITR